MIIKLVPKIVVDSNGWVAGKRFDGLWNHLCYGRKLLNGKLKNNKINNHLRKSYQKQRYFGARAELSNPFDSLSQIVPEIFRS